MSFNSGTTIPEMCFEMSLFNTTLLIPQQVIVRGLPAPYTALFTRL